MLFLLLNCALALASYNAPSNKTFLKCKQEAECLDCLEDPFLQHTDPFLMGKMEKEDPEDVKQVVVGVCAMAKKSNSKPMKEILARLDEFEYIKTVVFPEETILKVT